MNLTGFSTRFFCFVLLCLIPMAVAMVIGGASTTFLLIAASISLLLAFASGTMLGTSLDRTLERLKRATERFARGELSTQVYPPQIAEFSGLVDGLNSMAKELQTRVDELTTLSGEQEAILRSMAEGILTVTKEGRVIRINEAGRLLLGVSTQDCASLLVAEVVRDRDIQDFIKKAIESPSPLSQVVAISGDTERRVQVYSSTLRDADGGALGVLLVLQDITRVEQLERIRRDFVANLSHELRTPITSIKGFVETLLEGAKNDPLTLDRFLGIIGSQAERLQRIFSDLLILAKLEAEGARERLDVTQCDAREIVENALRQLQAKIDERRSDVRVLVAGDTRVKANASLLQAALSNLIDNAVTYSGSNSRIEVRASHDPDSVRLSVTDNGPGIDQAHQSRVFERFYRVDTGRSRSAGGTGLGLAIVKHIAQAHGGSVELESVPNAGSTFTIILPQHK